MSDTPRTDVVEEDAESVHWGLKVSLLLKHARQLERELNLERLKRIDAEFACMKAQKDPR